MGYNIEKLGPCRVSVAAALASETVALERRRVVDTWRRNARLPGFRQGKAPVSLVERRFALEIEDDLTEELIRACWREVRSAEELRPAGPLQVRKAEVSADGGFALEGEFEVFPVIEIGNPAEFSPPPVDLEPTPEEIDAALQQMRERQAAWEPVEGEPIAEGMLVEVEVRGQFPDGEGEPFREERSLFVVGKGEVYPEIEQAVLGAAVGATVTAEANLGEAAGERAGARVHYEVLVKGARRKRLPDLDDAFAASLGVEQGLAVLTERVRERLRFERARRRRTVWRDALIAHLAGDALLPLPEGVVKERTRSELLDFARELARRGVDVEKAELDWAAIERDVRQRVERVLHGELVLDALAERLGVEVSEAELDGELEKQARLGGVPFAELKGNLAKRGDLEHVRALLRREKATDQVLGEVAPKEG
ncbi:MAG: trigger factor [Acidobacteriota bacterium]|jgi:trigger factor